MAERQSKTIEEVVYGTRPSGGFEMKALMQPFRWTGLARWS